MSDAESFLPARARFNESGAAVCPGTFYYSSPHLPDAAAIETVALWIGEIGEREFAATIYSVSENLTGSVVARDQSPAARLHLPAPLAVWIRGHCRKLPVEAVKIVQHFAPGSSWRSAGTWAAFGASEARFVQGLSSVSICARPHGDDLDLEIEAVTAESFAENARAWGTYEDLMLKDHEVRISFRVSFANRCVVFGAPPGRDGAFPHRQVSDLPDSRGPALRAASALAGAGAIYGRLTGPERWVAHCWRDRDAPLRLYTFVFGSRADGLFDCGSELHTAPSLNLTLREVERWLIQALQRAKDRDAAAVRVRHSFASGTGSLGHLSRLSGRAAAEEGEHRRNVDRLNVEAQVSAAGLALRLDVGFTAMIPETVRNRNRIDHDPRSFDTEVVIPWESLILAGSALSTYRDRFV